MISTVHSHRQTSNQHERTGFTLIELLVVIAIIAVLGGLTAFFWPGFSQRERSAQGASDLQGWLQIARQRALLEQAPRGVRLLPDPLKPGFYSKAQYIEQPDDFTGGRFISDPADPTHRTLLFDGVDLYGGFADPTLWPVQPGDYIQVHGSGLMHQILPDMQNPQNAIQFDAANNRFKVILVSPLPEPVTVPSEQYRIVRRPRVQDGKELEMPFRVGIDLNFNVLPQVNALPRPQGGPIDILFSPSGEVLSNVGRDKLIFWIRNMAPASAFEGDPALIVLYTRSGFIASFPANVENQSNPLSQVP